MTTLEATTTIQWHEREVPFDEAQLAAAAFLARYSGRTLDAYRQDLRAFFQWASTHGWSSCRRRGRTSRCTGA